MRANAQFCSICGQQKAHFRLVGYKCRSLEHDEQEHQIINNYLNSSKSALKCPYCLMEAFPGQIFCRYCGSHIGGSNAEQTEEGN